MRAINCVIADDEKLAREIIESHISKIEWLRVAATCATGSEVYNALKSNKVELLFLDIQMPQLTGIELLRTLKNLPPVILTTAYREFALEGYELNVLDYLLKPISFERFLMAVDKVGTLLNAQPVVEQEIKPSAVPDDQAFIYVKSEKKMVRVMFKDILVIEGLKDYVKIHMENGAIITHNTLTYFEEKLSANYFARVHRSFIISLNRIESFSTSHVQISKREVPIGNSYAKDFFKKLSS